MRLDVPHANALGARHRPEGTYLVQHEIHDILWLDFHFPPPEPREIGEARMRADGHAGARGKANRLHA